jgi:hypothetical protein
LTNAKLSNIIHLRLEKGGKMKKLFTIAVLAGMLSGLYGLSFGLGGRYDIGHYSYQYGVDSSFSYPSVVVDVMVKPIPVLGFRFGIFTFNILPEEEKDYAPTTFVFGTGCDASVLVYIPMAGTISPYFPVHFIYNNGEWGSQFTVDGGVGVEAGFGGVSGYLEGGINFFSTSPEGFDSQSANWFYVQGGVRVPLNL